MNIPRCPEHRTIPYARPDCAGCHANQRAPVHSAQNRPRAPPTRAKTHPAAKEAGGGTEQFSIAEYDRRMSER